MSSWFLKETEPSISGYKETGEIEYAADTALDHMAVTDENESPVEVHLTKNRYFNFKGFAGVLHRERNCGLLNCRESAPAP
jgi:hypothetical protein